MAVAPLTILVTGASGYLGSNLVRALLERGHRVIGTRRGRSDVGPAREENAGLTWKHTDDEDWSGDLSAPGSLDVIVHTATNYGRDGESFEDLIDANVRFPQRIVEQTRSSGAGLFLNAGTALPAETSSYGSSKHRFVDWLRATVPFEHQVNLRLEHFYGPGDGPSKFVTFLIHGCLAEAVVPLTPGEQQRDFLHVRDVVRSFLCVIEADWNTLDRFAEFSVGSGRATGIRELAEMIHRLSGSRARLDFGARRYRPNELMFSEGTPQDMARFGWRPETSLEDGLRDTILAERERLGFS